MSKANDPVRNYIIAHYGKNSPYLRIYDIQHGYASTTTPIGHGLNNKPPVGPVAGSRRARGLPDPLVKPIGSRNTAGTTATKPTAPSTKPTTTPTKTIADRNTSGGKTVAPGTTTKPNPTATKPTVYPLPRTYAGKALPLSLANAVGHPLSNALAGVGSPMDLALASRYAGAEFNPQIQALQNEINFVPKQTAQNLHDINSWYEQVLSSLSGASSAAAGQGAANAGAMGAAGTGIMQSLGGDAAGVGGIVGDARDDASALANQLGSIESNFLSQESPLLHAESAAASTREQARQQAIARDLVNQQLGLRGQMGAKQSDLEMQFRQYNNQLAAQKNQNLLGIGQYNNSLTGQKNQNLMSIMQYNNSLTQQQRQNAIDNLMTTAALGLTGAQTALVGAQAGATAASVPGKFIPWDKLTPPQQGTMLNSALKQIAPVSGALHGWKYVDPADTSSDAQKTRVANQRIINGARTSMRRFFMSQHYANPRLYSRIDQAINQAVKTAAALAKANQPY